MLVPFFILILNEVKWVITENGLIRKYFTAVALVLIIHLHVTVCIDLLQFIIILKLIKGRSVSITLGELHYMANIMNTHVHIIIQGLV